MAPTRRVNYDEIAAEYDRRFEGRGPRGVTEALTSLAEASKARRVLEVGCGTGYWLQALGPAVASCHGLDLSRGMLERARGRDGTLALNQGRAGKLPFASAAFDLVYCVNAIHHFTDQRGFVQEARRVLRAGGVLAVIGFDPRGHRDRWYVYDYFPGTYERDLERFPSWETVVDWMSEAGFDDVTWKPVELIVDHKEGRAILDDHFFQKYGSSQLVLLSEEEYAAGRRRVEEAAAAAEAAGETVTFRASIQKHIVTGWVVG